MQNAKGRAVFVIDGYEVSATFADEGDAAALGRVKQILLSSFASRRPAPAPEGILAIGPEQRDNSGRGNPFAP